MEKENSYLLADYSYDLPDSFIAQSPATPRTNSKLMVVSGGKIEHRHFSDILDYLKAGDVLVVNETKVRKALLHGCKSTGGKIEVIMEDDTRCRIKGSKIKVGTKFEFSLGIHAEVIDKKDDVFFVKFNKPTDYVLETIGVLPTPPYIKKELDSDSQYQTAYSRVDGSVAAPTAGLHFDDALLDKIQNKGVKIARVCLHVSFATFHPVRVDDFRNHVMHEELFEVTSDAADLINNRKGRLFVVGTTSLKCIESAIDSAGEIHPMKSASKLFIYPGYKFKNRVDGMITNFHLPKSTLLLLLSALIGREKVLSLYEVAKKENYRFFSLGDAMLIMF